MFNIFQVVVWGALLIFISSKIKNKYWLMFFSSFSSFLVMLEALSFYLTGSLVDYRFYNHININAIIGHGYQFVIYFAIFSILFMLGGFAFYFASKKLRKVLVNKNVVLVFVVLVCISLLSLSNGILNNIYNIYEILDADEKSFNEALSDVGIPPEKYITPNQLVASKGKNIVVISVESLEQGFLGSEFNGITPNLVGLSKEWTYYNKMPSSPGGSWTAGSLYSYQVGVPAFFKGQSNSFFQGASVVKLTGLGHVLNKAGYKSKYIVGNKEFAGMADIITAYGIEAVSEKNSIGIYNELYDLDLFNEAKLQVIDLKRNKNKPFAIFLSTLNTHFPHGIYDKRMEEIISKRGDSLEFSVMAVDYLIKDFINFLKKEDLYDNTAIFIFPDHLFMGNTGVEVEKLKRNKRQLYLLTNINETELPKKIDDILYQIDLPKMIIEGAGIETNATFLIDFIKDDDVISYINQNIPKLTTLNTASVEKTNYMNGIDINIVGNDLIVSTDDDMVSFKLNKNLYKESFDVTFNSEMVVISKNRYGYEKAFSIDEFDEKYSRLHLAISVKAGHIDNSYFGNKQYIGISKQGKYISYSGNDIELIKESNIHALNMKQNIRPKFIRDSSLVSVTSSEKFSSRNNKSIIRAGNEDFELSRGLNILTVNNEGFKVEHFDTYGSDDAADKFLNKIEELIKKRMFWVIASDDSIKNSYVNYKEKLSSLGFKYLQGLNGSVAYIAYSDSGQNIKEHSSQTSLSYIVPSYLTPLSKNEEEYFKEQQIKKNKLANAYAKNTSRFIAHAGGGIDGRKYTNSLEALNHNYAQGFRFFELDIIKTSDNYYVAAHGWDSWAKNTGYIGELPPSRKVFLDNKILNKYTSLDIDAINTWFSLHPEAVLVTDKVNSPIEFSEVFIDKNRLMMELFTWAAVKEGVVAKIRSAMPSGGLIFEIQGDKVEFLKKLGVSDIAISRRLKKAQRKVVKEIKASGINFYAFHLYFDKGKDEKYVVCKESQYFYGMYADKWNFNETLDCAKNQ